VTDKKLDLSHHGDDDEFRRHHANETMRLLLERSSCRSFSDRKIPPEVLHAVLEAGIHAPSGGNLQPYSIIQVEDPATKQRLDDLNENQMFIAAAPVDLIFCIDWHRLKRWAELEDAPFTADCSFRHFWISFQDTIIAAQNICTAADAMGLGSVYVGTVLECFRQIRQLLALPDGVFPVVLLSLGYPKERPKPKRKLGIDVIVHNEKYRDADDRKLLSQFAEKYPGGSREITPERLDVIERVCREVGGDELARTCLARIRRDGHINMAQHYFGLHYRADIMPLGNDDFLRVMKEFGFGWFEPYGPAKTGGDK
jgi:FMN reductase [NAD(P)H]